MQIKVNVKARNVLETYEYNVALYGMWQLRKKQKDLNLIRIVLNEKRRLWKCLQWRRVKFMRYIFRLKKIIVTWTATEVKSIVRIANCRIVAISQKMDNHTMILPHQFLPQRFEIIENKILIVRECIFGDIIFSG